jgi:hypothetical protein
MNIANINLPAACSHLIQRPLVLSDLDSLLTFRKTIFSGLTDPDWVLPEIDEIHWGHSRLIGSGKCTGLFDSSGNLVAYASMYCPPQFTPDCPIPMSCIPANSWHRVAVIDSCMVDPQYRGNGLQRALICARFKTAEMLRRSLCVSLTSLMNDPSRHNLMSCGLSIQWIGETEPKRLRQVLMRDLTAATPAYGPVTWVPVSDLAKQTKLTSEGYRGFCERFSGSTEIGYALPVAVDSAPASLCNSWQ